MHEDLVKAFVGIIPLPLLDHPLLPPFIIEYVKGESTVPTSSWIRRDIIPNIFEKEKKALLKTSGRKVWLLSWMRRRMHKIEAY